jgi:hypothetical protein
VVPRKLTRHGLNVASLAAAEVVGVGVIAARYGTDGPASTVAALVLAPVAVGLTYTLGRRLAGDPFGFGAAAVYVALPFLGWLYMLSTYRASFAQQALPELVGLRATPWFALGLVLAALALLRPLAPLFVIVGAFELVAGFGDLDTIRIGMHETVFSITLLEWLPIAGTIGAARCSSLRAATLAGWLAFAVGHAAQQGYDDAAFWQSRHPRSRSCSARWRFSCHGFGRCLPPLTELELEQSDSLGEDHILIGHLRDHGRVVQQDGEHEEQGDREENSGRVRLDADPAGDRIQTATPRREGEEYEAGQQPEQRVALAETARANQLEHDGEQQQRCGDRRERDLERRARRGENHASSSGVVRRRSAPIRIASITFAM